MGQIKVQKNVGGIEGLCVIEPAVHGDSRGYFMETYNQRDMEEAGLNMVFVQDNQSCSTKGVLRGLHFQKEFPQGKLVRVIKGSVYDVAVDLRSSSETYGKYFGIELTEETRSSSIFRKVLHMVSWCFLILQNSVTNVQIFIIREMKVVWHGMIRRSVFSGRNFGANTKELHLQKAILWTTEQL